MKGGAKTVIEHVGKQPNSDRLSSKRIQKLMNKKLEKKAKKLK